MDAIEVLFRRNVATWGTRGLGQWSVFGCGVRREERSRNGKVAVEVGSALMVCGAWSAYKTESDTREDTYSPVFQLGASARRLAGMSLRDQSVINEHRGQVWIFNSGHCGKRIEGCRGQ